MRRKMLAAASLLPPAAAIGVTGLLWHGLLEGGVALRWSAAGTVVTVVPALMLFLVTLTTSAVSAAVGIPLALSSSPGHDRRPALLATGLTAGLAAAVWIGISLATLQAASPDEARVSAAILPFVILAPYGTVPWALAPRLRAENPRPVVTLALADGENGAWVRTMNLPLFISLAAVAAAGFVIAAIAVIAAGAFLPALPALLVLLGLALLAAAFSRIRITVDWRGLRIVSTLLAIPIKRIRLDRMADAHAALLRPLEWGGWGYRMLPGRSALITREGPGLVVRMLSGRRFAVTLPDPEIPAALLNTLRTRRAGAHRARTSPDMPA